MTIDFPVSFEPSPALAEAATLYERYFQISTAQPFDKEACESAFSDWKAAMESVFPAPRPPDVTDEQQMKAEGV